MDLVEARKHIEIVVAGLAATRRDADDLRDLRKQLQRMERARTIEAFVAADVGFHLAVAAASKNVVLSNMLVSIQSLLRVWVRRVIEAAGDLRPSYDEHVPVLDAIERGDTEAAAAAMAAHMDGATARLRAALDTHALEQSAQG